MIFKTLIEFNSDDFKLEKGDIIKINTFEQDGQIIVDSVNDEEVWNEKVPWQYIAHFCERF